MIKILPYNVILLFLVVVIIGTSTPAIFHKDIATAQIFYQLGSNGINFGTGNLLSVNNPALFDPLSVPGLYKDIATAQIFDQVAYL